MAFIEMTCKCDASFQVDLDESANSAMILMWANQFINSHADCGFMNPVQTDAPEKHRVIDWDTDVKDKKKGKKEIE